ncbi:MAG TPA: hypothetical protein VF179_21250 [Thermoanaerobaculia bacterium]|nr:hypothetical protein [Thermoanaerobaculia bacterium]
MEPKSAAPRQGRLSPFTEYFPLASPISGTVTIGSTGSLSGSGSGWQTGENKITFNPAQDNQYYSLSLQPPQGWMWNESAALQISPDDDNLCGFFSNHPSIAAFNSPDNQTAQVLTMILSLVDAASQPVSFTVFLHFPTASSAGMNGNPSTPQPLTGLVEGTILGTVEVDPNNADHVAGVEWECVGAGCSAENNTEEGGRIFLKPFSILEVAVKAWDLSLNVSGEGWEMGDAPAFEVCPPSNPNCGVVFAGPAIKAYNHLQHDDAPRSFNLALKLTNETLTQWIDDPAIAFDPPDPPI